MTRRSIEAGKAVIVVDILDKANASFNKLTSKMMSAARGLRNLGQSSAGAGLLTGLVSRSVINNFTDFEDKILNLSAKLGYFGIETAKQKANMKELTKVIIDLGRVTSYTSAEVADAAISLAQAGFSVTEIKSSLQSVLDLARGTNYALGESADLLANTIRTFNLFKPGDSAKVLAENMTVINHVSSMMVKATRLGTIEIQDLRESMKYAGGTAVNLGSNLSTVLGLLVQMSESGLKASLAGTSMNTAFLNLAGNLEQLQGRLPKFQLFMSTLADGSKGVDFGATFKSLMSATKDMDRVSKTKLFQDIFNIRGARMVSSVQEMERVVFFINEISAAGEEARLAAAKMESGLGGAIRRLKSGFEALNIAAGYTFKDGATAMANFATVGVAALEKLTASHKILVGALVFSPVIFIAIAASAMTLSVVLARLRTVILGLGAAFGGLKRVGGFLGGSLKNTGGMIAGLANNQSTKAAAIKALQLRVAKQGAAIEERIQKATTSKNPSGNMLKIFSTKAYKSFLSNTMKLQAMKKTSFSIITLSKSFGLLTLRLSRFVFSWNFVGLALNALLLFGHKIPFIRKAFEDVGKGFSAAFSEIGKIVRYTAPALKLFSLAFEAFVKGDTGVGVAAVSAGFSGLVSIIQNQLSAAWNAFAAKVASIYITFKQIFVTVWSIVDALVKGLGGAFSSILSPIFDSVGVLFSGKGDFGDNLRQTFMVLVLSLNNFITNFTGAISKLVTWGKQFAGEVQIAIGLAFLNIPGFNKAGLTSINAGMLGVKKATEDDKLRQDEIKKESKAREDAIQKAFFESSKRFAGNKTSQVLSLNTASQKLSEEMSNIVSNLSYEMQKNQIAKNIETQRLTDLQNRNKSAPSAPGLSGAMQRFEYKLATLVGSIQQVSGNRLLKESPKELETLQDINANIKELNKTVKTQGM